MIIAVVSMARAACGETVTFITPQRGGQATGPTMIEVTTSRTSVDRVDFFVDGALAGVARHAPYRLAHDFGDSTAAHDLTAKVWSNGYRNWDEASIRTAALTSAESLNIDAVEVPMRVRSAKPLRPDDFRVIENGIAQTVREVRSDRGPARFVFVVDRSLSMGDGKLDAALHAITDESRLLRDRDQLELLLFNHNVSRPRPIARGERLPAVVTSGGTSLRDALASIVSRERTYAIVITDGGDRNSVIGEEAALRRISNANMIVTAVVLGSPSPFLRDGARNTGGTVRTATAGTLQSALREIIEDINSRYTLAYQSHGNGAGWRSIVIAPAHRGIDIVNARKGYFAQ